MRAGELLFATLDLLFPPRCLICTEVVPLKTALCTSCMAALRRETAAAHCPVCGKPPRSCVCTRAGRVFAFSRCRSAFWYTPQRAALIEALKRDCRRPVAKQLAVLMAEALGEAGFDCVTEVPMPEEEIRRRGHNQARTLAVEVSELLGIPHCETPLLRCANTPTQHTLSAAARAKNAKSSYARKPGGTVSGRVLLIDDVATTCSTLGRCAELLLECGADEVVCLTAVTTLLEKETFPNG